jgi:ACT domain pair
MPKAKHLTVSIENRPGTLASVGNALGDAKVKILAFLSIASGVEGHVQLVVDDVKKAEDALEDAGFSYSEKDVLHIELPNRPGALGETCSEARRQEHQHYLWLRNNRHSLQEGKCGSRSLRLGRSLSPSLGDAPLQHGDARCLIFLPDEFDVAHQIRNKVHTQLGGYLLWTPL